MDIFSVITLLGGLAMFLYGMEVMGDGLENASGSALKQVLGKATQNLILGVITGMLVTAVIQSSTATIVLTVGLISANILDLKQAVSIVMGANIGTTVTAQIIRLMDIESGGSLLMDFFKPSTLAPLALIVGVVLIMFVKSNKSMATGEIFAGFGILFSGLLNMTAAVTPLSESQAFLDLMQRFSNYPLIAILLGLVMTVIVQSSSAMVGMIQALSVTGAMTFNLVYPLIMGINLGTCVTTALVCSIGSSKDAKRVGIVHIAFNVIGTILFMIVMTIIKSMGGFPNLWESVANSGSIANFQTLFNLVTAIALIPFAGFLVKLSIVIVKPDARDAEDKANLMVPDVKLFEVPAMALSECNHAIARMGEVALKNIRRSYQLLQNYDVKRVDVINENEDQLDQFTDAMDGYLVNLSKYVETDNDNQSINILMQANTNFERIGDHAVNIMEAAQSVAVDKIQLSPDAKAEMDIIKEAVMNITKMTVEAFDSYHYNLAKKIEPLEEVIDDMVVSAKNHHVERLKLGQCNMESGMIFVDLLTNLERIADQCSNIALLILSQRDKSILGNHHNYLNELHKGGDVTYDKELEWQKEQYLEKFRRIGQKA